MPVSFITSVHMEQLSFRWTDFHEVWYWGILQKSIKVEVSLNRTRIMGILLEDQRTFLIISRWVLLRMKNVSDKSCRENQNTYFIFYIFISITSSSPPQKKKCRLWDNVEKYRIDGQAIDDNTIWPTHIACWITKTANTRSDSVILLLFHRKSCYMNVPQC